MRCPFVQTSKKNAFQQLIHLDILYSHFFLCVWWPVDFPWWRDGLLVASWLVTKLAGGEMSGNLIPALVIMDCSLFYFFKL